MSSLIIVPMYKHICTVIVEIQITEMLVTLKFLIKILDELNLLETMAETVYNVSSFLDARRKSIKKFDLH